MTESIEPRVGGLYLVLFEGEWTAGRVTAGGIVVVGDSNEWPLSLVEQWGPEIKPPGTFEGEFGDGKAAP